MEKDFDREELEKKVRSCLREVNGVTSEKVFSAISPWEIIEENATKALMRKLRKEIKKILDALEKDGKVFSILPENKSGYHKLNLKPNGQKVYLVIDRKNI